MTLWVSPLRRHRKNCYHKYDKTGQIVYNENKDMPAEKFLTIKEVAKRLRVSERSVMRYIKAGKLVASKMGQWRIREADLEKFFKKNTNK